MAFDRIVEGGKALLSQTFGDTAYGRSCRCEWNCPGHADHAFHAGIDIASGHGEHSYLLAVGYGVCVKVGRVLAGYSCSGLGPYAPCIRSGPIDVWYGHALRSLVKVGDRTVPGQRIAIMGSVGCSTGTHVHYEVLRAGSDPNGCGALDPWPYVLVWPGARPAPAPPPPPAPVLKRSALVPALAVAGAIALVASAAR